MDHKTVLRANREYYNVVAADYRKNESYAYSKEIIKDVTELLFFCVDSAPSNKSFLDFGCGSGFLTEIVFKRHIFRNVTGIDISPEQVRLFNKKFTNDNFKAIVSDIADTGLKSNSFDAAGCYSVLHHIYDYKATINEITRVLKPGGIFYCDFEPNRKFQQLMYIPIKIRRKIIDKPPAGLDKLERIAEYHNTYNPGIDKDHLVTWLCSNYEVLKIGPRFPKSLSAFALKIFFHFNWSFSPFFYIIARKKV